ncbi:MAG: methylmalonyl-CoA mutase, partial [Acidobacteria bacterium]|nr:methylmalonyl-CoA mutase [Acidobacteriota bacterium]
MAEPSLRAFPPVSYREWRALVESELEGAAFTKLCARTADGLLVDPLYAMDEPGPLPAPATPPGLAPFTRHASACG